MRRAVAGALSAIALLAAGCLGTDAGFNGLPPTASSSPARALHPDIAAAVTSPATASTGTLEVGASRSESWARWNALRGDSYELDSIDRFVESPGKRVRCSQEGLVIYRGEALRYHGSLSVNPAFRERLERFEQVVAEVAREVYGREPRRIRHYGAYSCRTSRGRSYRLSEHALGNAVDVVGFDFGPATKSAPLTHELPGRLKGPFEVRVAKHWNPRKDPVTEAHSRFLHQLTARLLERRDIFRGFVGPGHPGHADHLHFDVAPWRYVRL